MEMGMEWWRETDRDAERVRKGKKTQKLKRGLFNKMRELMLFDLLRRRQKEEKPPTAIRRGERDKEGVSWCCG
jgi:hypothetical protein